MPLIQITCHRCGRHTPVDLDRTVSGQRCRHCRGYLLGVDVSIGGPKLVTGKRSIWRIAGAAGAEPEWKDGEGKVTPRRFRWPKFFKWTLLISGFLAFFSIGSLAWWKFQQTTTGTAHGVGTQRDVRPDPRASGVWHDRAYALAEKALKAATVDELLPLLWHPETNDAEVRAYHRESEPLPLGRNLLRNLTFEPGADQDETVCFFYTDSRDRRRALVVVEQPEGMRVDWACLAGRGELSLKDYVAQKPGRPIIVRAQARLGQYYNHAFHDDARWLCIQLTDVRNENPLFAYADRSLPTTAWLEKNCPVAGTDKDFVIPIIATLERPKEACGPDQTQLKELIRTTWYLPGGLKSLTERD